MNDWVYLPDLGRKAQVLREERMWGHDVLYVWVPGESEVRRVSKSAVTDVPEPPHTSLASIRYRVAAAKIGEALAEGILLAPLEGRLEPLPHQLGILRRVIDSPRIRLLLADEVGLGKTIEAGLIIRELKLRGLVRRILIVAPKGLVAQWVMEMKQRFNETFRVISGQDIRSGRLMGLDSLWDEFDQVIVSQDAMKPVERRRHWSTEEIDQYNQERFESMVAAGWDLVVVDEAHRLSGTTDAVARFRLGEGLAQAAPALLLLSATPHQGKSEQFRRLLSLLDPDQFIDEAAITPDKVEPYVVRTEKRQAVDRHGQKLFQPRRVTLVSVSWDDPMFESQRQLYHSVTEYVRRGVQLAQEEQAPLVALRLLMLQRMVASSTRAIRQALQNRLAVIRGTADPALPLVDLEEETGLLDGPVLSAEEAELQYLLDLCDRVEAQSPDARALRLITLLREIQQREATLDIKVLIFTEFLPTQAMLAELLAQYGFRVAILNGSMDAETRLSVQQQFRDTVQILVSSEAGGEGLNLQFCHIVVNYDLPWNPMRIEQRIGRIDRIGQTRPVEAYNFILEDSVEYRVHEVLVDKLETILQEFGIDKLGDVLDSSGDDLDTESLVKEMILHPERADDRLQAFLDDVRHKARAAQDAGRLLRHQTPQPEWVDEVFRHPFPHWLKTAVTSYIEAHGGSVKDTFWGSDLVWPDGRHMQRVVFRVEEGDGGGTLLNWETPGVRELIEGIPRVGPADEIPRLEMTGLPPVQGLWSIWAVELATPEMTWRRYFPLFLSDDGRVYHTTAQKIWDVLLERNQSLTLVPTVPIDSWYDHLKSAAEEAGRPLFEQLFSRYQAYLLRERDKTAYAFSARRALIERVGLEEVRRFRLRKLEAEEAQARARLDKLGQVIPDLSPVVVMQVVTRRA